MCSFSSISILPFFHISLNDDHKHVAHESFWADIPRKHVCIFWEISPSSLQFYDDFLFLGNIFNTSKSQDTKCYLQFQKLPIGFGSDMGLWVGVKTLNLKG